MAVEITTFEPVEKVNPYLEDVKALAEAGENAAAVIAVDVNDAQREAIRFQKAANTIGKTARLRVKDESGVTVKGEGDNETREGEVKMTFTLTEKHKVRRGKKD